MPKSAMPDGPQAGEAGAAEQDCASTSSGSGEALNSQKRSRFTDTKVEFNEEASNSLKAEWEKFFVELEAWRQEQYETYVELLKKTDPHLEPAPREDRDWQDLNYNRPLDILAGTAPPVPPGRFPAPTKEEIIAKEKQRQGQIDLLSKNTQAMLDENEAEKTGILNPELLNEDSD
jgi:hypothetical protein